MDVHRETPQRVGDGQLEVTLDVLGLGDGGVVRVHVHGVTKGQAHLPAALCAQLVQPESCMYYVYYISVYIICILE